MTNTYVLHCQFTDGKIIRYIVKGRNSSEAINTLPDFIRRALPILLLKTTVNDAGRYRNEQYV